VATTSLSHGLATLRKLGFRPSGILDVGAYNGEWSQMVHQIFPDASILMIEAQPKLKPILEAIAAAHAEKIHFRPALLGAERRDEVEFYQMDIPITTGSSLYEEQTTHPRSVLRLPMVRLDDLVAELSVGQFQMIKLDVQGAELDVLRGATSTLADVEVLIMEMSLVQYNKGAPLFAETVRVMEDLGFRMFDIYPVVRNSAGILLQVDAMMLQRDSGFWAKPPFS
jgi:FkbM family methyltransferase